MKAAKLSLVAAAAALAGLASLRIPGGAVGPISSWFLRSEADLQSLRELLRAPAPWREIESLSERMTIWKVESRTLPAEPGDTCTEKILHRFEFASRKGMSSRVYRLDYTSCRVSPGEYDFDLERSGFGSQFRLGSEPLARGPTPLRILRLALEDGAVSRDLVETLREKDLAFCQVVADPGRTADPPLERYIFRSADAMPGDDPGPTAIIEYCVEYDPVTKAASFEKGCP
jgi:hypothetical protein